MPAWVTASSWTSRTRRPRRSSRRCATPNFAFWHSATFNSDGTKVVFTDELGGGGAATCNAAIGPNRGANAIYDLSAGNELTFKSYFKIPRHQGDTENCVAHNGSIVPVKGRDVMVQSWYQGGVSLWEFTDSGNPRELGYFERGPLGPDRTVGGTWSAYYYNGFVYSSDIHEGLRRPDAQGPDAAARPTRSASASSTPRRSRSTRSR